MSIPTDKYLSRNMYPEHDDKPPNEDSGDMEDIYVPYGGYEDGDGPSTVPEVDNIKDYDFYMESEVMLPIDGDRQQSARVVGFIRNNEVQTIGELNHNPILNTKIYDVMFPDGAVHQYTAKTIAENIYSQVDEGGHRYKLIDHIRNHKSDGRALTKSDP